MTSFTFFFVSLLNKTSRFHVAVRLFSQRSHITSKCGKNKKVAHEAIAECETIVYQNKNLHGTTAEKKPVQ